MYIYIYIHALVKNHAIGRSFCKDNSKEGPSDQLRYSIRSNHLVMLSMEGLIRLNH